MEIFYCNKFRGWLALLMLIGLPFVIPCSCPSLCECSPYKIDCRNAGLKAVPNCIQESVHYIDFSHNPSMRLKKEAFKNFAQLRALKLNNCSLKKPIDLPINLHILSLADNSLTVDYVKNLFISKLLTLKSLDLRGNALNIPQILQFLPRGIEYLELSRNAFKILGRDDLKCNKMLKKISCQHCGLQRIESNAFDHNSEIEEVNLSFNRITALPDSLFEHNSKLATLDVSFNLIDSINSSKLMLKELQVLELGHNRIETFDLRFTKITEIGLESNKIAKIVESAFEDCEYIHALKLHDNNITYISKRAFHGVKYISELLMQNNNLNFLPDYVFNNTAISKIFLHKNRLSSASGLFVGMKRSPGLLTLFLNKEYQLLNISSFESMSENSEIFITCNNLKRIIGSSKLRASIKCSPSADLTFRSPLRFWSFSGYECVWKDKFMQFLCHACPAGFYHNGNASAGKAGKCIECPAGSFYQDELASSHCKSCPVGQFVTPEKSPGKDASDCQSCPEGTNTNISAGTRACRCLSGFHRLHRFGACKECKHAGFLCSRDFPQLKKEYWMTWDGEKASNQSCKKIFKDFVHNLEIFDNSYDRSTMTFNCLLPIPIKCPIHGSCNGGNDVVCSSGYTGALCAVCSKGFSRHFNRCVKCPDPVIVILEIIGYMGIFVIFCLILSLTDKVLVPSSIGSEHDASERRTFADVMVSSFKIMIGFYQILISVVHAFSSINWPDSLKNTISLLEYIQFEVIRIPSLSCIKSEWNIDSLKEFWFIIILTFAIPFITFIYYLLKLCSMKLCDVSNEEFERSRSLCSKNCINFTALFLFATYPLTSTKIIQVLPISCHSFCTMKKGDLCIHKMSFLRSDYSIPCSVLLRQKYTLISAYICLIIPFGLPIILWLLLWRYAPTAKVPKLSRSASSSNSATLNIIDPESEHLPFSVNDEYFLIQQSHHKREEYSEVFTHSLKFAYENYNRNCWYWEVLEMIRKFIMTVGVFVVINETKLGLSVIVILAIGFALIHALRKPIKDDFENAVQLLSLLIVPLNLTLGTVLQSNIAEHYGNINIEHSESWSLGIILVIMNLLVIILIVGRFLRAVCRKLIDLKAKKGQ